MTDTEAKNLQDCLAHLTQGVQDAKNRTAHIETTLTTLQSTVSTLDQHLSNQVQTFSVAHEQKNQQLQHSIEHLDTQFQELRTYVATQIADLTTELRTTLNTLRTSFPTPHHPPSSNNLSPSHPTLTPSSPQDPPLTIPSRSTIIIQPPTAAPSFSGQPDDKPRPFLLQLTQYTSSSFGWDKEILFQNIGQFLRGTALEWYTQIITSHTPPLHWDAFHTLFLQQFSSPLRLAQLEQQWNKCIQKPNESINEFLVRLRSLWSEHKPQETEHDLVRHLFTKIRPQLVPLIGVLTEPTLENFLMRTREAELIDFSRSKQTFNTNNSNSPTFSTRSNRLTNPRSNVVCYNCNIPGHLASQCTRPHFSTYSTNTKN
ncbi:unnamed protein product [Rotaria magnacalcarata]|uniref:CCHC-type domain-containing protein n=1 Tax=Rotaria magnacalcarata TaxID=392030 RepID=A0A819AXI7_9BILA|nr:unnamed protein product [Rotaria magnacalcarata]CAF3789205.1 unnamed protein product [Rotaria magnacalcarata]